MKETIVQDSDDFDQQLEAIFRSVFKDESFTLSDSITADTMHGWDSLKHVNLIMALESEFEVKFRLSEFEKLTSVATIRETLQRKLR